MQCVRGFIYWLLTNSPFAFLVGTVFRKEVPCGSGYIVVPEDASPYTRSGIVFGAYEYSERFLIKKWLPSNLDVVELGSSIGIVSRDILTHITYPHRLISVEALEPLARLAEMNVARLHPRTRWHILPRAVAYNSQEVLFNAARNHVAGRIVSSGSDGCSHATAVRAVTLANLIDQFALGDYSLVMDIEGAEHAVLTHDKSAIDRCQCLISELHGSERDKDMFCKTLTSLGMMLVERKHSVVAFVRH